MNEILQLNNNNNNSNNNIINNNNNDNTGFTVYILYQKEVQNTDHGLLQSMMDWIYMSNDSPYKYVSRNKSVLSINNYDITLHKDSNIKSAKPPPPNNDQTESSLWTSINFNLKYLKEIYVDKRHKDTCVLVSKVSSSTKPTNNVWKKSNPSNYQPFKSLYSNLNTSGANNNSKRSYLLTVLKFKDGPSKLLQSIQMLDRVLTNFDTKQEANNNTTTTNNNNNNNNQKSNGTTSVHTKSNNKTTSTKQQTSDGEQPVSVAPKTSHKSSTSTTPATNSQSVAKKSIENASTATLNQQQLQLQLQLQMQQQIQQQLQQQQQNFQPQAQLLHLKQLQQFQYDQQQQSKQDIIQSRKSVNLSEIGKSISSNKQPNSSSTHHTHGGSVIASDGNTNMNRLSLNSNIFYAPSSLTQHSSNLVSNNSNHQSLQNILPSLANANNSSNKSINNMSILNKNKAPTSSSNSLAINNNNNNNNNENNNESTNTTTTNNKNNFNFQLISQMLNSIHNNMNSINNSNSSSNIQQQANNQTKSIRNSSYLNSSQFNIQQQQQQLQQKLLMQQQQLQQQQQQQKQHHRRYSQYYPVKRSSSRLSSRYSSNYSQKDENVLSSDNFSEIGYQQYQNKKLNNSSVASVSTATNTNARNLATSAAAGANKSQTAIKSTTSLQNTDFETLPRRHSSFVTPNQVILQQQQQQQQQQHNRTSIYDHLDEKDSNLLKNTIQNFRLLKMAQANSSLDNLTAFPSNVNTEIDKEMRLLPIQSKSKSKSSNHSSSSSHHNHNHNHHNHRSKIVSSHDSFDNHEAAEHNYHQIERPKSAAAIIKSSLSQVTKKPPILSSSKKLSTKRASGTASSAASFHHNHNHNHHNHNHHNHHHSSSNSLKAVSCDLTNKLIENIVGINLDVLKSEVEAIKLNKVAANSDNKQQQPLTTQLVSKSVKSKLKQNDLTTLAVHSDSETANANDILLGSDHHRSSYYNLNSKLPPQQQQQQTNNPDFILSNKLNNSLKRNTIKINDPAREPIRLKEIINSFNSYENNFSNNLLSTTNDSITTSSNTATPTNMTLTNSISNPTTTTTTTTLANITAAIAAANNNLLNTSDLNQSCDSTNCGLNNNNNNNGYCNDFCPINNSSDDKSNQNGYSSYYSDYYNNGNNGGNNNNNNNGEMIQAPKVSKTVIDNSELTKTNSRKSITSSASSVNCIMQQTCFNNNNNDENNKQIEMNENNNNNTYNTTKQQPVIIDCFENSCKNNFYNENTLLSILEANSINTGSLKDDVAMLTNKIRYYDNEKLSKYYNSFYEPTYITDLINNNNNNNSNNNNNNNCNGNCNTPTNETNDFCLTSPSAFTMDTYSNNDYQNAQNNPENMYLQQQQQHHHHQQQQTDNTNHQLIVNNTAVEQQQQQQPMPPPTKNRSVNMSSRNKRTFANMVWPMDPEEEKILRSNSPFIVPEIIVQRNEAVKSILKKNINSSFNNYSVMNINNNNSNNSILSSSPSPRASTEINLNNLIIGGSNTYGKKRVDFHENFLFVNVFDKNADEELNSVN